MKRFIICTVLAVGILCPNVFAQDWTGNLNAFFGMKYLDEDDWEPVDDQGEMGAMFDFQKTDWPVAIAFDILASANDDDFWYDGLNIKMESATAEICTGVRKIWETSYAMKPFIGGGVAVIFADVEAYGYGTKIDDDDSAFGLWIDGGVYWTVSEHFNIGADIRFSNAEVTLFGADLEAGGSHFGLLAGYHW